MFNRITIIGMGLIGGSLALAIKQKKLANEIVGVSRRKTTINKALSQGIVDAATLDAAKWVKGSDLIILTVPVLKIIDITKRISKSIAHGAIVTDAGSTKEDIVREIESVLPKGINFVGSHPLAGSEKSGLDYANKDLFKGSVCILTKTARTDIMALDKVKEFWRKIGMRVEVTTPEQHDKLVSNLSHLPHAAAVALSNACGKANLNLMAGGYKDTTRIASGNPELWRDIFITNRGNIIKDIKKLKKELSNIESALKSKDNSRLLRLFEKAKSIRDSVK